MTIDEKKVRLRNMLYSDSLGKDIHVFLNDPLWKEMRGFLVGGAVRDALENKIPRDLDIMVEGEDENALRSLIDRNRVQFTKNAFNGYKLIFKNLTVDIWFTKDHYIFKDHLYKRAKINLARATFLNYDSLVYDLQKHTLNTRFFDECIEKGVLDIVGKKEVIKCNPNPILSLVKILIIMQKNGYQLSQRASDFVADVYNSNGDYIWTLIESEYRRHYAEEMDDDFKTFAQSNIIKAVGDSFSRYKVRRNVRGQYSIYDYMQSIRIGND
jgi:hypothetical protein